MPHRPGLLLLRLLRRSATSKKVVIYGGGPSLRTAAFPSDCDKWSVGSLFPILKDKIDLYFCLHTNEHVDHFIKSDIGFLAQNSYPLKKIFKKFGSRYFTNSISYMIAYAIYKGYQEITLEGIDLEKYGEYVFERPSIAYWCGRAESLGIKINWFNLTPCFLYGYEGEDLKRVIGILKKHLATGKAEFEANENQRIKDQWAGYIHAVQLIMQEIES